MKKTLLFTVAIALMAVAFFGCQNQPLSGDINFIPKADGAPAVAGDKISTVVSRAGILVHWEAASDAASYIIYRQEVVNGDPKEGTLKKMSGTVTGDGVSGYSTKKRIPYYTDNVLLDGVVYRYGIAAVSYRSTTETPAVSEIVWQSASSEKPYPTAQVPAPGSILPMPASWPSITVTQYNTTELTTSSTAVNYKDRAKVVLQNNFSFDYQYKLKKQVVNVSPYTESNWAGFGTDDSNIYGINEYLDEGGVVTLDLNLGYSDNLAGTYTNRIVRLVLEVTSVAANDTLIVKDADPTLANENLNSNQTVIATGITAEPK